MVAPNSPSALAKPSTMPAMMPGSASGSVTVKEHAPRRCAERAGGLLQPAVDGFDRQPDRPHHQRKPHDPAGQRRAGPAERKNDAEMIGEPRADRAAPAERQQQQIAGDHRRQHQRQMHQCVEQRLAPEIAPRQQPGHARCRTASRPASRHGDPQRQQDRGPFGRREIEHAVQDVGLDRNVKPYFSKIVLRRRRAQECEISRRRPASRSSVAATG